MDGGQALGAGQSQDLAHEAARRDHVDDGPHARGQHVQPAAKGETLRGGHEVLGVVLDRQRGEGPQP